MIPFLDLKAQFKTVQEPLEAAVLSFLRSGNYVLGEPVAAFERAFAEYCGVGEAVAVSSGTAALHLALLAAGVEPGDEVITVPMTFVATVAAIHYAGAKAVLVDVDPNSFTMSPEAFEAAITPATRAVVPVHLHGRLADMAAIGAIANRYGITVIEDACQAHGAERDGIRAGAFGSYGCFSFYPGKNLGACGEGGAVITDDSKAAQLLRSLRDWGQEGRYNHVRPGFNLRLDAIQAVALQVKLPYLDGWTQKRKRIAAAYERLLGDTELQLPAPARRAEHVFHVYAIQSEERDWLRTELAKAGVSTGIHYPRPVHLQPAYAGLGYEPGDFPVSERLARRFLSLPIFPELVAPQLARVASALIRCCEERHVRAVDA
ncbi:DegT/DnrJ/EryC1/StrS aminotransferase family protein [Bosea sp. BIWAKO-01]|uniref:DegT/DnrJ/EryC1/StrS family aminotransferase n=1 Tax=Bosea sp. BIWAKO-01 TaxID=506668 RepID=UPI000853AC55|nr:DegT/DnrJ/EryC1/StrS family aminotransferase [Bosea sp. BIWAKO-01]GAU83205.1 UDP-4-amino-4-deoxy-L-arabinose-oxoglutarate aminotransferase [Bosea sp. BIWAKO-01]